MRKLLALIAITTLAGCCDTRSNDTRSIEAKRQQQWAACELQLWDRNTNSDIYLPTCMRAAGWKLIRHYLPTATPDQIRSACIGESAYTLLHCWEPSS